MIPKKKKIILWLSRVFVTATTTMSISLPAGSTFNSGCSAVICDHFYWYVILWLPLVGVKGKEDKSSWGKWNKKLWSWRAGGRVVTDLVENINLSLHDTWHWNSIMHDIYHCCTRLLNVTEFYLKYIHLPVLCIVIILRIDIFTHASITMPRSQYLTCLACTCKKTGR
jgi:hypothetical protein